MVFKEIWFDNTNQLEMTASENEASSYQVRLVILEH